MMKCKKNCETCPVYLHGKCFLDQYNNPEAAEEQPQAYKGVSRMRWLADEWDGRAEGARSPELMTNLEDLPNPFDRMLEESSDFYVIAAEEAGYGASQLTRIVKKREGERLHHPIQDMEDPDEENESEDVMDHAIMVPMMDDGTLVQDYEPGPQTPSESWDLVFEIVYKPVPVDVKTDQPISWARYNELKEHYHGDLRGIVTFKLLPFEQSSPQYFMPKFRNHRPTPEVKALLKAVIDGRIKTPLEMFKAMEKLKTMLTVKPPFSRKQHKLFKQSMVHRVKERVDEDPAYKPEVLFFMFARRLWDFFHRVYQMRDPKGYRQWIARKTDRTLKAKQAKQSNKKGGDQAPKRGAVADYDEGYLRGLDEIADMVEDGYVSIEELRDMME